MRVEFRHWYEAEALMRDLAVHRHEMLAASEEETEGRVRERYTDAAAVLVRQQTKPEDRRGPPPPAGPDVAAR